MGTPAGSLVKKVTAVAGVVGVSILLTILPSAAEDYIWSGGSGAWEDPSNWTPVGVPSGFLDSATLRSTDATARTVTITSRTQAGILVDSTGPGMMTLSLLPGTEISSGLGQDFIVGRGIVNQGENTYVHVAFGDLDVRGTYNLNGGGMGGPDAGFHVVVRSGGVFNHRDGGVTTDGSLTVDGTYNFHAGSIDPTERVNVGASGPGIFNQYGGLVQSQRAYELYVGTQGSYNLRDGTLQHQGAEIMGTFNQTGGRAEGVTAEGHAAVFIRSGGTYNLRGGTMTQAAILNDGTLNVSGGRLEFAGVVWPDQHGLTNNGVTNLTGPGTRVLNDTIVNTGTFKTTNTSAVYTGTFTNNGAYISDPATQRFTDLIIGPTGYLKGGVADFFYLSGDFINHSTKNTDWNTALAYLGFIDGADALHDLYLSGADYGAILAGYKDNFSWGILDLVGDDLRLYDGNEIAGGALYVGGIWGLEITDRLVTNITGLEGLDIYYLAFLPGNAYLHSLTYDLTGGGHLIPVTGVPEPSTLLLLGTGLVGLGGMACRRHRK